MQWLGRLFPRYRRYDDLAVSIREHLEERTEELMEEGMTREEATRLGLRLTIIGVLIGLVGAFVSTRLMASLLFEIARQTRSPSPFPLRCSLWSPCSLHICPRDAQRPSIPCGHSARNKSEAPDDPARQCAEGSRSLIPNSGRSRASFVAV